MKQRKNYKNNLTILAIETSCDDTSIAILKQGKILCNVTSTTFKIYKRYGGIVPELAAREHCFYIDKVCRQAIKLANISFNQIDYIAFTNEPGLIGSLQIGKVFANQLSLTINKPTIKINHMFGHIFSFFIDHSYKLLKFPLLALVVSGGHTFIAYLESIDQLHYVNQTIDDAVGEALDKIGRYLNLPYPGGVSIDNIYSKNKIIYLASKRRCNEPFTFSGIKTAALNKINFFKQTNKKIPIIKIASSSLDWIVNDIYNKLLYAINTHPKAKILLVGGGVAANKLLSSKILSISGIKVYFPSKKYTNDNAAMIANYAYLKMLLHSK